MRRLRLEIAGAVQGVGFRPHVFRIALHQGLTGWVRNDARGVFIEVDGLEAELTEFARRVQDEAPANARLDRTVQSWHEPGGFEGFEIRHSDDTDARSVLILPDLAMCSACLEEIDDPRDRRFNYAFANCTDCGPRFSIIEALPYDRPKTTMAHFAMCEACQAEYDDPMDRRFHAQPNACSECGPQVALWSEQGEETSVGADAIQAAADLLGRGEILAVKGLGGYHLMVDATSDEAVRRLRERKHRPDRPVAVMVRDLAAASRLATVDPIAAAALCSQASPIVLVPRLEETGLAAAISPETNTLGLMVPYTPLHHLLLDAVAFPVVATSGNLSDEPICTGEKEALGRLAGIADAHLVHDRPIARHVDDSVAWSVGGELRLLRRARGFAPLPVSQPSPLPTILAAGGQYKNAVGLSLDRHLFLSQHIGDLETPEARTAFERAATELLELYDARPVAIAHDLHPDYAATRWATRAAAGGASPALAGLPLVGVQHHHAHLASCLADNGIEGAALGVTWDGSGFGVDGAVWGGEMLLGDASDFERVAHLRSFGLPGGDAAVRAPDRVALALLYELDPSTALSKWREAVDSPATDAEAGLLIRMLERGIRTPRTTSAGRLFDGVAALVGLRGRVSYEGQAAIALEALAVGCEDAYAMPLRETEGALVLDWGPIVEGVCEDRARGVEIGRISGRFHETLARGIAAVAAAVGEPRVALSGGCFQNRRLTERAAELLEASGFEVLLHRQIPPNDGGLALGQLLVAAARVRGGIARLDA